MTSFSVLTTSNRIGEKVRNTCMINTMGMYMNDKPHIKERYIMSLSEKEQQDYSDFENKEKKIDKNVGC